MSKKELLNSHIVASASSHWISYRSLEYVRNCYISSNISVKSDSCQTFTVPTLDLTARNVICPFSEEVCGQPQAFQVDTGDIDSNRDLGINSAEEDRIQFRKLLTCVPMPTAQFSTDWTDEAPPGINLEGNKYKYSNIGDRTDLDSSHTWAVSNYSFVKLESQREEEVFKLGTAYSTADMRNHTFFSNFKPIPGLEVQDLDTTVVYLINNARYPTPVEDPWFRATNTTDPTGARRVIGLAFYFWISDEISTALACTEQYQFCTQTGCSALAGIARNNTVPWRGLQLNEAQRSVFNMISTASLAISVRNAVLYLGSGILRANEFLWYGDGTSFATGLPPTHWQDEVINFGQVMEAALQRLIVDFATPSNLVVRTSAGPVPSKQFIMPPRTQSERDLCYMIRVRDARYTNFSATGLAITLMIGIAIMMMNAFMMPRMAFWLRRKLHRSDYPEREWSAGDLLMQQKDALSSKGIGPWEVDGSTGVPWVKTPGVSADGDGFFGGNHQYSGGGLKGLYVGERAMQDLD